MRLTTEPPLGWATEGAPPATTETRYDNRYVYTSLEGSPLLPEGKVWIQVPVAELGDGGAAEYLGRLPGVYSPLHDPAALLEFLRATSGPVERVGQEQLRGIVTTHYRGAVSLETIVAQAEGPRREVLETELEWLIESEQPTSWHVDVWIDRDGLARRLTTTEHASASSGVFSIDYYDFGVPVDIQMPPPALVVTAEEFGQLLMDAHPECNEEPGEPSAEADEVADGGAQPEVRFVVCSDSADFVDEPGDE